MEDIQRLREDNMHLQLLSNWLHHDRCSPACLSWKRCVESAGGTMTHLWVCPAFVKWVSDLFESLGTALCMLSMLYWLFCWGTINLDISFFILWINNHQDHHHHYHQCMWMKSSTEQTQHKQHMALPPPPPQWGMVKTTMTTMTRFIMEGGQQMLVSQMFVWQVV